MSGFLRAMIGAWIGIAAVVVVFLFVGSNVLRLGILAAFVGGIILFERFLWPTKRDQYTLRDLQFWDRPWWQNALLGTSIFALPYGWGMYSIRASSEEQISVISASVMGLFFGVFMGVSMGWQAKRRRRATQPRD